MGLSERIHYYWNEMADPRSNEWLLTGSPYHIPLVLLIYLYIILYWGPRYMRNRSPYSLKTFIKFYNVFQIIANAWQVREHIDVGWFRTIPLGCIPVIISYEYPHYKMVEIMWFNLVLKIIDCVETVVFILRKKNEQLSVLHVYHHVTTIIINLVFAKYMAGEMALFITLINCMVHVLMYTYYFLAAFGPRVQAIISPFKPYLTIIQMIQFIIMIAYSLHIYFSVCDVPRGLGRVFIALIAINFYLFYKFYKKSYNSPKVK